MVLGWKPPGPSSASSETPARQARPAAPPREPHRPLHQLRPSCPLGTPRPRPSQRRLTSLSPSPWPPRCPCRPSSSRSLWLGAVCLCRWTPRPCCYRSSLPSLPRDDSSTCLDCTGVHSKKRPLNRRPSLWLLCSQHHTRQLPNLVSRAGVGGPIQKRTIRTDVWAVGGQSCRICASVHIYEASVVAVLRITQPRIHADVRSGAFVDGAAWTDVCVRIAGRHRLVYRLGEVDIVTRCSADLRCGEEQQQIRDRYYGVPGAHRGGEQASEDFARHTREISPLREERKRRRRGSWPWSASRRAS